MFRPRIYERPGNQHCDWWGKNTHLDLGDIDRQFVPEWADFDTDYTQDLGAIIKVVLSLPYKQQCVYMDRLTRFVMMKPEGVSEWDKHNATARERCEAYLRTLGKWKE